VAQCQDMVWEVRFDAAFVVEAKTFSRAAQVELAA
jgi:hypothetical protein